jgi:oxazoline/thiazoline synthase
VNTIINTPVFKDHLHVEVIPGEGVLILSEEAAKALHGAAYEKIVPLIDGCRSTDEIVDALAGQVDTAKVYYALALLEENGHIAESAPEIAPATAAFWHGLGIEPRAAVAALRAKKVHVRAVGNANATPLRRALDELGIAAGEDDAPDLEAAVTDDYLNAELNDINAAALRAGRPWLLVRPLGLELWLGPLYVPGKTGCHQCLRQRLKRNRLAHKFVADRNKLPQPPVTARAGLPATIDAACALAAVEIAKHLAGVTDASGLEGNVLSLDVHTWSMQIHALIKHPACPACGKRVAREPAPVRLESRKVTFAQDGGHRSATPAETLKKYQHLVSEITGVVKMLVPIQPIDGITHVYMAGHNPSLKMERLDFLKRSLRNASCGKGISDIQAKTSARCEAIERYSGEFTGLEYRKTASYREFAADEAIHPNAVMRFSDAQYREREAWNARKSKFNSVPDPLDEDSSIDWSPVWSLTHECHKYLPTQLLYYQAKASVDCDKFYSFGCSNGNASGNNIEEAILHGFFELVERDAVALWWYNCLKKPGVDVASFGEPYLVDLIAYYDTIGREAWALELTTDLGIPAFVAVSRLRKGPEERILFGLGCHLDGRIALQRAFAEMNQMLGMAEGGDEGGKLTVEDDETMTWLKTATVANQPYMAPDDRVPPKRREDYPTQHSGELRADIDRCRRIVEERGMEMLVLDQTRADVGMAVAKMIVPGLRHFRARFAPGRLYDVPVQMGWLEKPLREDELNPIPIIF